MNVTRANSHTFLCKFFFESVIVILSTFFVKSTKFLLLVLPVPCSVRVCTGLWICTDWYFNVSLHLPPSQKDEAYLCGGLRGDLLQPRLAGVPVRLHQRGGPAAGHVDKDGQLLEDAHHLLVGLADKRDPIDLQQASITGGPLNGQSPLSREGHASQTMGQWRIPWWVQCQAFLASATVEMDVLLLCSVCVCVCVLAALARWNKNWNGVPDGIWDGLLLCSLSFNISLDFISFCLHSHAIMQRWFNCNEM